MPRALMRIISGFGLVFLGVGVPRATVTCRSLRDKPFSLNTGSPNRRAYYSPILCHAPELDNVILATDHHRNGIVLAPITATLISELIMTGQSSFDLTPFGLPQEPVPPPVLQESADEAD